MSEGQIELVMALAEEMKPQLEEKIGPYKTEIRDETKGTATLVTPNDEEENYVLTIYGDNVLLSKESAFVEDRVPVLVEQLVHKHIGAVVNAVDKLEKESKWKTDWVILIQNPDTQRWFVITMEKEGGRLAIVPEDMVD